MTGLAAARALVRRGADVTVLEQFQVGHTRGSSHGTSRIFRLAYAEPRYVRLARESLPLWHELEREAGETLLVTSGSLDLGPGLDAFATALDECGVAYELLSAHETQERCPLLVSEGDALFQPQGGVLRADRILRALGRAVDVVEATRVRSVRETEDGVELETERGTVRATAAVVAAGAWAKPLAPLGIDLPLQPTRETVVHLELPPDAVLPTVIDHHLEVDGTLPRRPDAPYALLSPGIGLKVGVHQSGPYADPDEEGAPDAATAAAAIGWARRRFRFSPEPALVETCLYTNAPDSEFLIERRGVVVVASACSGHAFKFAPALGERLADLALEVAV